MPETPGHSHGSIHPVCVIGMTLNDTLVLDFQQIDDFLSNGFLIKTLPFDADSEKYTAITNRISFLANSLLQAIKVPVFEQAKIADIKFNQDQKSYRIRLISPILAGTPQEVVLRAYGFASKILTELHPKYDFEAAFEAIDKDFVKRFKAFIPGGLSIVSVAHAAFKNRVPFMHLGSGIFQLGWGAQARRFDRSANDRDTVLGNKTASDKRLTNLILSQAGYPVPHQIAVSSLEAAIKAGQEIGYPVVLKPAMLERGEGVTIDIFSDGALRDAYLSKQTDFENLLVEKQINGLCYRIFIAGKKVRHVVARHPMHVIGDGEHTIRELADTENAEQKKLAKHRRRPKLEINEISTKLFSELGLGADSVPLKGMRVPFQRIESTELGGIAEDVWDITHPDNITLAEELAEFCGLDVIGVDIISEDISKSWHENGAKINEVNFAPLASPYRDWVQIGLNEYTREIFPQKGRIPIQVFSGGARALIEARRYQAELLKAGQPHFLCSRTETLKPDGNIQINDLGNSLFLRAHALLLNKTVEGIIFVLQDDSVLMTGFPFDGVSGKELIDDQFLSLSGNALATEEIRAQIAQIIEQLPIISGVG